MNIKIKLIALITIFLWASAFVGIRSGLGGYTPEGLALLRYLTASVCMGVIYMRLPTRQPFCMRDIIALIFIGAFGIGFYNITLNYGEMTVSSGISSFIVSQAPILTVILAAIFFNEKINLLHGLGFAISFTGISIIALAETHLASTGDLGVIYLLLATFAGACYSLLQKKYLIKYHPIEATSWIIWGGTLSLLLYLPQMQSDVTQAAFPDTLMVIYLGVFPGALGYLAWGYVLSEISAVQAGSYLYYIPFFATGLGWLYLGEIPVLLSVIGGVIAILGVWLVEYSYHKQRKAMLQNTASLA